MKTLATCTPIEFLKQTNKIRKSVQVWLEDTKILEIRNSVPALTPIRKDMEESERLKIFNENKAKIEKASRDNLYKILDEVLEKHPEETLEVLALCCFIEPENANEISVRDYLNALAELLGDSAVMGFFTSLAQWGQMNTSTVSQVSD